MGNPAAGVLVLLVSLYLLLAFLGGKLDGLLSGLASPKGYPVTPGFGGGSSGGGGGGAGGAIVYTQPARPTSSGLPMGRSA